MSDYQPTWYADRKEEKDLKPGGYYLVQYGKVFLGKIEWKDGVNYEFITWRFCKELSDTEPGVWTDYTGPVYAGFKDGVYYRFSDIETSKECMRLAGAGNATHDEKAIERFKTRVADWKVKEDYANNLEVEGSFENRARKGTMIYGYLVLMQDYIYSRAEMNPHIAAWQTMKALADLTYIREKPIYQGDLELVIYYVIQLCAHLGYYGTDEIDVILNDVNSDFKFPKEIVKQLWRCTISVCDLFPYVENLNKSG